MTPIQALKRAKTVSVYATDVIHLQITKVQARKVLEQHEFHDAATHMGQAVATWDLNLHTMHMSLSIPA